MSVETLQIKKEEPRMLFIETIEKRDSGYVRIDTKGTAVEEKIDCPSVIFIPNKGKMAKRVKGSDGKERIEYVKIRYIKGYTEIEVSEQKRLGIEASLPSDSIIQLDKGSAMIKEEGDLGLFNYIDKVFWNESAPDRPKTAKAIFKVVEVDKKSENINEKSFLRADAVSYVNSLVLRTGKDSFRYKESKIDSVLNVLNTFGGDNYSQKINALIRLAENNPADFLQKVKSLENVVVTEITHALELNVLYFSGNNVEYVNDKKILANLGEAKMKKDKQVEALADLLMTPEYASAYQELKAKTEVAKENKFKN